ncbi:MAG: Dihydrolipoyllysine-residue acetyltransferase component of acetoin cleaving system [candidate division WS6 bacterium OLB20]|uniref:Dihydrolipoyllysine-residue acetyltransferase component of acetoin cleaving system n=1 Tax=candidate division WS6 bacterium OLB20 TaxID=1617426 RepID=A0A136M0H9_9BACT|nr:MAG: Dihydrolipoyllysine-residue acetyltransferase component of acetoin cleaving system [candidate division WS6 bacterium OLB20]
MKSINRRLREWFTVALQKIYLLPKVITSDDLELFTEHDVQTENFRLHYAQAGKGETLLFIHGMSNNWIGWIPLAKELINDYHLVMLDLPGYGESERLAAYNVETEAEAIAAFLRTTGIRPRAIVGLSMGSIVTGQFLSRHGQLVDSAVLCGPMFQVRDAEWLSRASRMGFTAVDKTKGAAYALKRIMTTTAVSYVITKYLNMYRFNRELVDAYGLTGRRLMDERAFIQMGISVTQNDLEEDLNDTTVPVRFIYGQQDRISSIDDAQQRLSSKRGNFTFVSIPDAGHIVTLEKPGEVAESIRDFIRSQ